MSKVAGVGAVLAIVVGGAILVALLAAIPSGVPSAVTDTGWMGPEIWKIRGLDLAAQALVVLTGVFGVLVVLGREVGS